MLQSGLPETDRLTHHRRGRALAWASIVTWAAGCVPLVLMLTAKPSGARDEIAAGIRAIGWLVAMALLAVGAVIGFILARLASRRIPDDDLAMVAYAVNIVTLVGVPLISALMFWL